MIELKKLFGVLDEHGDMQYEDRRQSNILFLCEIEEKFRLMGYRFNPFQLEGDEGSIYIFEGVLDSSVPYDALQNA